jgi:predicted RNA-binding Zn ribbon-like protein
MEYDTYNADAVQLAVDLANLSSTAGDPVANLAAGSPELIDACDAFVEVHADWFTSPPPHRLSAADREQFAHLALGVRDVAAAGTDAEAVDRLNGLLTQCAPEPRATNHDGPLHLHYSADDAPLVVQLGATVSMAMANLVCRYGRDRLGLCAAADCRDVFVDTSRNRSRRYCSETCASRTTVSAFRARRKAAAT